MGKVVLITGISSGFGKCTAELLAAKGYTVYGTVRRQCEHDPRVSVLQMDVTDAVSVQAGVDAVLSKEGRIDALVNNAGFSVTGALEDATVEEIRLQMDTNFGGICRTVRAVLPAMRKQGSGTIVNIGSIGGLMGLPFQGLYSASKFAVDGFSEALRMEVKQFNINVVLVNPGDFRTNFTSNRKLVARAGKGSVYDAQFKETLAVIEKDEIGGLEPVVLARKIHSILEKRKPRPRYVVASLEQRLAVVLKYILPESWFFRILEAHYRIK